MGEDAGEAARTAGERVLATKTLLLGERGADASPTVLSAAGHTLREQRRMEPVTTVARELQRVARQTADPKRRDALTTDATNLLVLTTYFCADLGDFAGAKRVCAVMEPSAERDSALYTLASSTSCGTGVVVVMVSALQSAFPPG